MATRRIPPPTPEELASETPAQRSRRIKTESERRRRHGFTNWPIDEVGESDQSAPTPQCCQACGHHYSCHSDDGSPCVTGTNPRTGRRAAACTCTVTRTSIMRCFAAFVADEADRNADLEFAVQRLRTMVDA